ncbi:MAG TPA: T9SS type A sorting domain-containing protein, partial [Flavihumibacter sp.]
MMTGDRTNFNNVISFSSFDNTSVTSGIGAAKKLVSVTNLGNGQHEVVYDVRVENFGNYPLSNVQVYDTLSKINGANNVVSASAVLVSNPAGVTLNSAYNGTTVTTLLANNQTLKNYPEGENNFTIRITVRLSNIVPGKIYYNSATATATGFGGTNKNLRDVSTDGSRPDLNLNGKPDDPGESVPTPFVVVVAGESPPCPVINKIIYSENFGTGSSTTSMPNGASTAYTGSTTAPLAAERYMITNNPANGNSNYWHSMSDHTGNANGRMLVVNADVQQNVIFSKTVNNLCSNLKYSLNVWVANISNSNQMNFCNAVGGYKLPKLQFRVRDASSGLVLTNLTTPEITGSNWQQHGIRFVMPSGYSSIILEIINQGEGGCGNDLALDDIEFGLCDADPVVNTTAVSAGCIGGSATFSAILNDPTIIDGTVQYQWQSSTDSINYTNINGATQSTYTIPSMAASHQRYYRVLVASGGNINNASCRYASPGFYLALKSLSTAPTSIQVSRQDLCPGNPVQLTAQGGSLGTNARYVWYAASTCGEGTPIGTGQSITVTSMVNRTYYVRIEGDCNVTSCASVFVPVGCDIDDDDDGIPDLVENHGIDDAMDSDNDGIPDYRDPDTPGFIDVNNDGIDDRIDADLDGIINSLDLDSDNDGIPDVVEAGGVDENGDGIIDNFTDPDLDGLSQNVDASNNGAANSGVGLGLPDLDGDGIPNMFDLDSDNDGIYDVIEAGGIDANNDGRIDIPGFLLRTGPDTNGDGRADSYPYHNMDRDSRPNPYDLDSDGDGITDLREAGYPDEDWNGMLDPGTPRHFVYPNTDNTGPLDYLDIDSDDDGIPDNVEGLATVAYQLPSGIDADGDGIDDAYDGWVGFGGNGISPNDEDMDGIPDYMDTDTDGDGIPDIIEGNDFNFNAKADDLVELTGLDDDGDGLDNRFDADNSSAKGTSAYMGNGGSQAGDPNPGSYTVVQRNSTASSERDWRVYLYVLSTRFRKLTAYQQNNTIHLSWEISSNEEISHFEVLRKDETGKYVVVATVQATVYQDNSNRTQSDLQYRIRAVTRTGKQVLSDVVTVKLSIVEQLTVMPNPTQSYLQVNISARDKQWLDCQLMDERGRIVYQQSQQLQKGNNSVMISGLGKYPRGMYLLRLVTNNQEVIIHKVILR